MSAARVLSVDDESVTFGLVSKATRAGLRTRHKRT